MGHVSVIRNDTMVIRQHISHKNFSLDDSSICICIVIKFLIDLLISDIDFCFYALSIDGDTKSCLIHWLRNFPQFSLFGEERG